MDIPIHKKKRVWISLATFCPSHVSARNYIKTMENHPAEECKGSTIKTAAKNN